MDFYDIVKRRYSVRKYSPKPIEEDVMKRVLKAAREAPSAENYQPWRFIVVRDDDTKRKIATYCHDQRFIAEAPVVIVALANVDEARSIIGGYMPSYPVDVAIAMDHLILAATAEGLGTCWIGDFKEEKLCEILNIPDQYHIIGLTPLGYPAEEGKRETWRKPLGDIVFYERFSE